MIPLNPKSSETDLESPARPCSANFDCDLFGSLNFNSNYIPGASLPSGLLFSTIVVSRNSLRCFSFSPELFPTAIDFANDYRPLESTSTAISPATINFSGC
jgi:hypothetical protein